MNEKRKSNLGRGLSALLGDDTPAPAQMPVAGGSTQTASILDLHPGRYQPRRRMDDEGLESLARSIREKGILQPILVRPHPEKAGHFEIIAGERRWRAAGRAGRHHVPIIVRELGDADALEIGLVENLQREDLTPVEEAEGLKRLMEEFGHTQEALSEHIGRSRSHIANTLRLLALPDAVRDMLHRGNLSAGHARALIGHPEAEHLAREITDRGLNVRQAEALAHKKSSASARPATGNDPDHDEATRRVNILAVERSLSATLGLRVELHNRGTGGHLTAYYRNLDQLDDLLKRLSHAPES